MATKKRRSKWTDPGDELVPISGGAVTAARRVSGLSLNALAKRLRIPQATLNVIEHGGVQRTRLGRLRALAKALGTNEQYLRTGALNPDPKDWKDAPFTPQVMLEAQVRSLPRLIEAVATSSAAQERMWAELVLGWTKIVNRVLNKTIRAIRRRKP